MVTTAGDVALGEGLEARALREEEAGLRTRQVSHRGSDGEGGQLVHDLSEHSRASGTVIVRADDCRRAGCPQHGRFQPPAVADELSHRALGAGA